MRVIAIANQKGGSAKSTTTVNLAAALAENRRRVLVIDLDPQGNTTYWLAPPAQSPGVYDVLVKNGTMRDAIHPSAVERISVLPASRDLSSSDKALAQEVGAETLLGRKLSKLGAADWDYILIDTPPTLGILTLNALVAARELIVPVEGHVLALAGLAQLVETIDVVRERLNPALALSGIVACRIDARTRHSRDVVDTLRERFGASVYGTVIRENIRLAEAPSFGKPITHYDSASTGAQDYRELAHEVMRQEGR